MIESFLNIKDSLRNLSDDEFERLIPILAKELKEVNYLYSYSERELYDDWMGLVQWPAESATIASTERIGMKLCEHFFPNFFDIQNKKGDSFKSLWKAENLEKVLRWNRKSHSTPYLSELKRGIYFNFNLPKSTMFRPQIAKMVVANLGVKRVLDPCAGWGGRMIGCVSAGADYVAFEPNTKTYEGLVTLSEFLGIQSKVKLINDSALNMEKYELGKFDCVLTSPPYFNLEVYTDETTQSITGCETYEDWIEKFLRPIIQISISHLEVDGWSCWNVHNIGKMKMIDDVKSLHNEFGSIKKFSVISSKRQTNKTNDEKKNTDSTICYSKKETKRNMFF